MQYVSRAQWGARPPRSVKHIGSSQGIYVHHTAGPESQTPRQIQDFHMNVRGWVDIAYSWLVDRNGTIYEGRGWGVSGAHTAGYNSTSHAVCYIGNTSASAAPTAAKASINTVINEHNRRYGSGYVRPHNAVNSTACPGSDLTAWINTGRPGGSSGCREDGVRYGSTGFFVEIVQQLLNEVAGQTLAVDGIAGPRTIRAVTNFNNFFEINSAACRGVATKATIDFLQYLKDKKNGTPSTPTPPTTEPTKKTAIQFGDRNYVVWGLQKMLNEVSNAGLQVDGIFGENTLQAVKNFQNFFKLSRRDGVVDDETWKFLNYLHALKTSKPVDVVPDPPKEELEPTPELTPEEPPVDLPVVPSVESLISRIIAVLNKILQGKNKEASEELTKIENEQ